MGELIALLSACLCVAKAQVLVATPGLADSLVCSVTQLLQASLREEEVPQVCVLSLRHRGDDRFFLAFLTKVTTQRFHGFHAAAEGLSLQLPVSLSVGDARGSDDAFGP